MIPKQIPNKNHRKFIKTNYDKYTFVTNLPFQEFKRARVAQ
jgi:hypothetical protein